MKLFCETQPLLQHKKVLIVDDEADFASIRFTKKKGEDEIEQGRIAGQVDELRRTLKASSFLQVTATPYSLYLQPNDYDRAPGDNFSFEPKRPAFTELLPIHDAYVGGDHYFGDHDDTELEFYLWHPVDDAELVALKKEDRRRFKTDEILTTSKVAALRHALMTFVTGAAIRRLQQKTADEPLKKYSLVVHVETARLSHTWQHTVVDELVDTLKEASLTKSPVFAALAEEAIVDLTRSVTAEGLTMPSKEALVAEVARAFHALRPGGRWLPVGFQSRAKTHIERTMINLDQLIPDKAKDKRAPMKVPLELALQLIENIESTLEFNDPGYGFDWNAFKAAIEYYSRIVAPAADAGYCYVLAVTDRSVSRIREEGRFLDAPDTKQQRQDAKAAGLQLPVLVLLRQNGEKEKGWGGFPFWWPVLFAPTNSRPAVFATTLREDEEAPEHDGRSLSETAVETY